VSSRRHFPWAHGLPLHHLTASGRLEPGTVESEPERDRFGAPAARSAYLGCALHVLHPACIRHGPAHRRHVLDPSRESCEARVRARWSGRRAFANRSDAGGSCARRHRGRARVAGPRARVDGPRLDLDPPRLRLRRDPRCGAGGSRDLAHRDRHGRRADAAAAPGGARSSRVDGGRGGARQRRPVHPVDHPQGRFGGDPRRAGVAGRDHGRGTTLTHQLGTDVER